MVYNVFTEKTVKANFDLQKELKAMNLTYTHHYKSPLGGITLSSNGAELTGLWFDGQKHFGSTLPKNYEKKELADI